MKTYYKAIKGRFKTGGRTIQQIKDSNRCQGMTCRDFENMRRAYDVFDGAIAIFLVRERDEFKSFIMAVWDDEFDHQIMMAMYYTEQTNPFNRVYKDNFAVFEEDWKDNEYDSQCAYAFRQGDIEVIETINILQEAGKEE